MQAALSILPLALVLVLLATRRVTLASAGLVALAATLPAVIFLCGADGLAGFLWIESLKGAWVSWQGLSVIFAGVVLHQVLHRRPARQSENGADTDIHRGAFAAAFLFGVFVETAVGFGVGTIVAVVALMQLGLSGPAAAALSVFSQVLVPWGAMAVGTGIGAGLLGVEIEALGLRTAEVTAMTLPFLLPFFWGLLRAAGVPLRPVNIALDILLILAMGGLLIAVNRYLAVELGGLLAPGILAAAIAGPSGSNTAAIAMMMPVMAPIATQTGVSMLTVVAAQNIGGGLSTMLSPGRIALAAGLTGLQGQETVVYRQMLPVTAAILGAPIVVLALLVL